MIAATIRAMAGEAETWSSVVIDARGDLFNGSLKKVRKVLGRTLRQNGGQPLELRLCRPREVPCPDSVLREKARPHVLPGLVPREQATRTNAPFSILLEELQEHLHKGCPAFTLLDWLGARSGLELERAAAILGAWGHPFDLSSIEMVRRARTFWDHLHRFTEVYGNATQFGQIEPAEGAWAFVETDEIQLWLPGIRLPKKHRRDGFLVRINSRGGSLLYLDFYSLSYCPLFRVPV